MISTQHALITLVGQRISAGLKRKAINKCSTWSIAYRKMGKPFPGDFSFKYHPWSFEMHDCEAEEMVGQKAAQMAFTETALNKSFYSIDILGNSVLYVLPAATPDASDFSAARFDPALELSNHLRNLFSNVKNVHHKRAGTASLYIRGSRSRTQMKSIPVALMIFDEYDEMNQDNVILALERITGQQEHERQSFKLSTPTVPGFGIHVDFENSTQDHYHFKCPHCSRLTQLIYPDCLVIIGDNESDPRIRESHLICKECKVKLEHDTKSDWLKHKAAGGTGIWVSNYTNRYTRGFQIPQLYSAVTRPFSIAIKVFRAETNPAEEQELWNSKCGLTHVVEGAKISDADLQACTSSHTKVKRSPSNTFITMGVDVGKWLHYEIDQWYIDSKKLVNDVNIASTAKVLCEGKVKNFEDLDLLMMAYGVRSCVIDANPERRKAIEFAQRFWGRVKLCFYGNNINGKQISIHSEEEHTITVDRTSWLDLSLGRFKSKLILLPLDTSLEYKSHIKAPVRIYGEDANKNPTGRYVTGNEDDHFAHARNYAEIALPLGANMVKSKNISEGV